MAALPVPSGLPDKHEWLNFLVQRPPFVDECKDDVVIMAWVSQFSHKQLRRAIASWVKHDPRRAYRMAWGKSDGLPFRFPQQSWKHPSACNHGELAAMATYFLRHPQYVPPRVPRVSKRLRDENLDDERRIKYVEEQVEIYSKFLDYEPHEVQPPEPAIESVPLRPSEIPGPPLPQVLNVGDWVAVHVTGFPGGVGAGGVSSRKFAAVIREIYSKEKLIRLMRASNGKLNIFTQPLLELNIDWPMLLETQVCKLPECRHQWAKLQAYKRVPGDPVNYEKVKSIFRDEAQFVSTTVAGLALK